jgi:hypothetical protein
VVEILRDAAGDGRLDAQELDERVERALQARTFAELEPLTGDLPVPPLIPPNVPRDAPPVADAVGSAPGAAGAGDVVSWSAHGQLLRKEGAWTVPRQIRLDVHGGSVRLDYTLARLPQGGASEIHLSVHGGSVRLMLPPGVAVDATGVTRHGGSLRDHSLRHFGSSAPITHVITVTGSVHGGSIKVLPVGLPVGSARRERLQARRAERRARWYGR